MSRKGDGFATYDGTDRDIGAVGVVLGGDTFIKHNVNTTTMINIRDCSVHLAFS